jgi:copper transport protein
MRCGRFAATPHTHDILMRRQSFLICALLIALLIPGVALAHPELVRTEPAANAQLATAPAQIRVSFNEELEEAFSDLQLYDARGQRVDQGGGGRDPSELNSLRLELPSIPPGLYTVVWQTVGSDGHKVKGNFVFIVLESVAPASETPAAAAATQAAPQPTAVRLPTPVIEAAIDTGPSPELLALFRGLMLLGALVLAGSWFTLVLIIAPVLPTDEIGRLARRWRRSQWLALIFLAVGGVGFALLQTQSLANRIDAASLQTMLVSTRLGQALLVRLVLIVLFGLLAAFAIDPQRPAELRRLWLGLPLGAALLLTFSLSGHAVAQPAPLVPVLADWLHLAATSLWVGGLLVLAMALPIMGRMSQIEQQASALTRLVVRFSATALTSVLVLTVSGMYAALLHLHALSDLWTSDYGRALLVKLVAFGSMLLVGAYHLLIIRSRFAGWVQNAAYAVMMSKGQPLFQFGVRSEVVLAVIAIGAAGFLTNTSPSAGQVQQPGGRNTAAALPSPVAIIQPTILPVPTRTPTPSEPFAEVKQVEDVRIGLEIEPASLGKNMLRVTLENPEGTPIEAQKVVMSLEMLDMDMGVTPVEIAHEGEGVYAAPESWFSMVGHWQVNVTVRRADADDVETTFAVLIGDSEGP